MTEGRYIAGLPLGCRMECRSADNVRVSVGMLNTATFNKDEWSRMVLLVGDKLASPEKMRDWLTKKALTKGEWRCWLDKDHDYGPARVPKAHTVGEVLDAWGLRLEKVDTEL